MRAGLVMLVILLLAACAGAPSVSSPSGGAPGTPGQTALPGPTATPARTPREQVRILGTDLSGGFEQPFSVAAATDTTALEALVARLSPALDRPTVDFEREVVLFLGMAGSSSCPERLQGLVVDETQRVYAEWAAPSTNQPCTDDLAAQGILLAVQRAALPSEPFAFSLRREPVCAECPDHPDEILVDPR